MTVRDGTGRLDPTTYRSVMSHWATGVSIIASVVDGEPTGCTANAVTSLSLAPLELLVCFDRSSDTLAAVRQQGRFSVNMLDAGQAELSSRFARKGRPAEKFAGVPHRLEHGVPVLEGALAHVICEVDRLLDGGDHEIAIGRPLSCGARADGEPLIFFRNGYGRHATL